MSTPSTSIPRRPRAWAWRPGPQPTSSTRSPGRQVEHVDEEGDLVLGALGERVPQVGLAEVIGEGFEPVVGPARRIGGRVGQVVGGSPAITDGAGAPRGSGQKPVHLYLGGNSVHTQVLPPP